MHGLINRSIQCFLTDTYGADCWRAIAARAGIGFEGFEAMLIYDGEVTEAVLRATCAQLEKPRDSLLEDLGTYLVSHPSVDSLRRLLRFGGVNFVEFLHSLDELHDRARLAVPDLDVPSLDLREHGGSTFTLAVSFPAAGFGHVVLGILRAMADEYGALVYLDHQGAKDAIETIAIEVLEANFAEGRSFQLAVPAE